MGRESSYSALSSFLTRQTAQSVHMTFDEVASVLGRGLPNSAFRYPAWWANNPEGHSHSRAWVEAGWKTEAIDLESRRLTFRRSGSPGPATPAGEHACSASRILGRLRGTVTIRGEVTGPSGEIWAAEQGEL